jgi:hypothetical protein
VHTLSCALFAHSDLFYHLRGLCTGVYCQYAKPSTAQDTVSLSHQRRRYLLRGLMHRQTGRKATG